MIPITQFQKILLKRGGKLLSPNHVVPTSCNNLKKRSPKHSPNGVPAANCFACSPRGPWATSSKVNGHGTNGHVWTQWKRTIEGRDIGTGKFTVYIVYIWISCHTVSLRHVVVLSEASRDATSDSTSWRPHWDGITVELAQGNIAGKQTVCYWTWPFIVDLPIKSRVIFRLVMQTFTIYPTSQL